MNSTVVQFFACIWQYQRTEGPSCSQIMFNEIHCDVLTRNVLPKVIRRVANYLVSSKLVFSGLSI